MKKLSRLLIFLLISLLFLPGLSANNSGLSKKVLDYIGQYKSLAVEEMHYSGIPASITIAQGILESRYGNSPLATQANNHFGIKCKIDWEGETYYADDDQPNECFRKYKTAAESFRDHSNFIKYNRLKFYDFLFEYSITDYKAWSYGLKKAGYATSKRYAQKLIFIIEKYRLYDLDYLNVDGSINDDLKRKRTTKRTHDKPKTRPSEEIASKPQAKNRITDFEHYSPYIKLSHIVKAGDTMRQLANMYSVSLDQLYRFNWMPEGSEPQIGAEIMINDYADKRPLLRSSH